MAATPLAQRVVQRWFHAILTGDAAELAQVSVPHPRLHELTQTPPAPQSVARRLAELPALQVSVRELPNDRTLVHAYCGGSVHLLVLQEHTDGLRVDPRYPLAAQLADDAARLVARRFYRALLLGDSHALERLAFDARGVELLAHAAPPVSERGQLEHVVELMALVELAAGEPFAVPSGVQFVGPRHAEMGIRVLQGLTPDGEIPFLLRQRDGDWKVIPFHFIQAVAMSRGATFGTA